MSAWQRLTDQMVAAVTAAKPRIPDAGRMFWSWFVELSDARSYHFSGPNPISHADIDAWARLRRLPIERRHLDLLRAMDRAWMGKAAAPDKTPDGLPIVRASTQTLTPEAFDAVFG